MDAVKAIVCTESQEFSLADVKLPELGPRDILVKNTYSGISIGTELLLVRNKLSWGPFPICLGYQAVGVVEAVGAEVNNFSIGDRVYHRGCHVPFTMNAEQVSPTSGAHSSHVIVDSRHQIYGAAKVPEGVDDATASLFVMPAVGLNGVTMAEIGVGDVVAVLGVGLIGLGVVATAKLRGAIVVAIDLAQNRLEIARRLGADESINAGSENIHDRLKQIAPDGADVVFEASGNPACVDTALSLCRDRGKFVFQGNYGAGPLNFEFLVPHGRQVTAYFPCDDGYQPCREAVLKFMASGAMKWQETITHRLTADEAPRFYDAINRGKVEDVVGAVIKW